MLTCSRFKSHRSHLCSGDGCQNLVKDWNSGTLPAITDSFFLAAMEVLVDHDLDIKSCQAAVPRTARKCNVAVVKGLLDLGADPKSKIKGKEASQMLGRCTADQQKSIKDALAARTT